MDSKQAQIYYDELRLRFIQPDNNWVDKGAYFRTIFENFFRELVGTPKEGTSLINWIDSFFDDNPDLDQYRDICHNVRKKLNRTVHSNVKIGQNGVSRMIMTRTEFVEIYASIVLVIFNCTGARPDEGTIEFLVDKNSILEGLNDQQKEAISCKAQIVNVNAGPGTGKTKLLVHKLVHFIKNDKADAKIVALSFTNTAAHELGTRFHQKAFECQAGTQYEFENGTIHSFCLRTLRKYYLQRRKPFNYTIIGDDEVIELSLDLFYHFDGKYTVDEIKSFLTDRFTCPDEVKEALDDIKKSYKLITINDILVLFLNELNSNEDFTEWVTSKIDILVVDESQDLSSKHFEIFDKLLVNKPCLRFFFVGDPRQNIFGFNGGSYKNLSDFLQRHIDLVETKALSITYRCPKAITDYVNSFAFTDITNNALYPYKQDTGSNIVLPFDDPLAEADGITKELLSTPVLGDNLLLSPTIKGLSYVINKLNENKIPYKVYGGRRTLRKHIKVINNLLKIIISNNEDSIRKIAKVYDLDVKTQPLGTPVHLSTKELFYTTPFGRKLRAIQKTSTKESWNLLTLIQKLAEEYLSAEMLSEIAQADIQTLYTMIKRYRSPQEYLSAFVIDKSRFDMFYDKDFVDCINPSDEDYVTLSTIHSAKGLEWPNVYILGMYENNFPAINKYKFKTEQAKSEYINTRLKELFVACTRCSDRLVITYPRFVDTLEQAPSSFLTNIKSPL